MKIIDKIQERAKDPYSADVPTIAFLGDSVTQGSFEVFMPADEAVETVYDENYAYETYISKILRVLYPDVPVHIVNAGISGDNIVSGYKRLEKDVLRYSPDLVVVSFGLNDATGHGLDNLPKYKESLRNILTDIKNAGSEVIFMTENMMNTYVSYEIRDEFLRLIADATMQSQNSGTLKQYFDAAKEICAEMNVPVCDVHEKWCTLASHGVNTTRLLSNRINHPTREMNWLFAYSLVETMMNN